MTHYSQLDIFQELYPKFKITKPIRLIELFAGYGSQALALKYLGAEFEHWKISEWNYKSFDAYNKIHFADTTDYSREREKEWLIDYLYHKGISADWDSPMTYAQIKKMPEHQIRKIYNDIQATHNLVDVSQITANDLEINDNRYCYILTYSFPCQDLSLAGLRKGMDKDSNTRSSLLWQVHRILRECQEAGKLPDVLLMENVTQVHSKDNITNFREWMIELEKLGYQSYWEDLIATDFEIPQIRKRTFMVSILGDYHYSFPAKKPLKKSLKDLLEESVDDKYLLSDVALNGMINTNFNQYSIDNALLDLYGVSKTILTSTGSRCPLLIPIKNNTKKGYIEAEVGDGIDISSRMKHHRGTVQKGKAQTLTTMGGEDRGVVIQNDKSKNVRDAP